MTGASGFPEPIQTVIPVVFGNCSEMRSRINPRGVKGLVPRSSVFIGVMFGRCEGFLSRWRRPFGGGSRCGAVASVRAAGLL